MGPSLILYLWLALVPAIAFQPISKRFRNGDVSLEMAAFGRSKASKIPTSPSERFETEDLYTALFNAHTFSIFGLAETT